MCSSTNMCSRGKTAQGHYTAHEDKVCYLLGGVSPRRPPPGTVQTGLHYMAVAGVSPAVSSLHQAEMLSYILSTLKHVRVQA